VLLARVLRQRRDFAGAPQSGAKRTLSCGALIADPSKGRHLRNFRPPGQGVRTLRLIDLHVVEDVSLEQPAVIGAAEAIEATANVGGARIHDRLGNRCEGRP